MGFGAGSGRILSRLPILAVLIITVTALAVVASPHPAAALDAEEQAFLEMINGHRTASGLGSLSLNGQLDGAARWMSQDMAANNYFSHTDSLGRDPFVRMTDFGYNYNTWKGENLAAGAETAQAAFELWKNSPAHNANMLNPNFKVIGIARAYGQGTTYGWYWATEFGGQGEPPPPPQPTPPPPPQPTPPPPPQPTPAPPPPPPPAPPAPEPTQPPEPIAEVTPEPTPEPTPEATPELRLEATPEPPNWREIVSQVLPWWERLSVLDKDGSLLRAVSYMAEQYLVVAGRNLVHEKGPGPDIILGDVVPGRSWLMLYRD